MATANGDKLDLPVIDISSADSGVAKQILDAASRYGFVFVSNENNAFDQADIQRMFGLSRDFFSLPTDVKAECSIHSSKSGKNRGWLSMHTETLDPGNQKRGDFKEAFNFGEFVDGKAQQPLPAPLADEEAFIGRFADQCHALCNKILELFATALEVCGSRWFSDRHDRSKGPSGSVLRLLYYPALKDNSYNPTLDIRAGAHSDYGSITLLFQLPSQPGLEILTPSNTWAPVPVNPLNQAVPPVLVNIGDLLSYWTNGLLKSTVHRVIFPKDGRGGEDRYSIAYFCHPLDEARLEGVPSRMVVEHKGRGGEEGEKGRVLTARDHLNMRLAATYRLKEEKDGAS
ncbi:hypothetical protein W97_09279 [Coniosporium apollinis CBS 100218]|uniref:Fe2OG dioxygenase domain-containing protein n=1 Tax=Coniosporium apollinis (strain CBS 100218) TaxID=1168221 RepID=R7Z7C6_CONA1|nr:uncharacterized protein W97_09279 [Coniosporium apollinis CBS 100218]EON70013.1 hypothetical protein W97_09279 [Coniosporium apollinis CBS 100218]